MEQRIGSSRKSTRQRAFKGAGSSKLFFNNTKKLFDSLYPLDCALIVKKT